MKYISPNKQVRLYQGDCLKLMSKIPDNYVDLILCDPPYGTTALSWDSVLDFDLMWEHYNRIIKDDGAILIFGQEPFSSMLRLSNLKAYRYDYYWQKERLTNVFQVKRRPGKVIENISVFYLKQPTYNVIKNEHTGKRVTNKIGDTAKLSDTVSGNKLKPIAYLDDGTRYPLQILKFNRDPLRLNVHPTQKPVALLEYLIKTYTDEGMVVLDNTMGSGSTGVACVETKRKFIGIELIKDTYLIALKRIKASYNKKI